MSEKLGPIAYGSDNNEVFLGRDMGHIRDYSEEIASEIDSEIRNIVNRAYEKTEDILRTHDDQLHSVAEYLIEHEKVDGETFRKLMDGSFAAESAAAEQPVLSEEVSTDEPSAEE